MSARLVSCALVVVWSMSACVEGNTSVPTGMRITPEYFQYATMIEPPADGSPGGWRAVCIHARIGQSVADPQGGEWSTSRQCSLQFEGPIINHQHGYIPLRMAQRISAEVANEVAYRVLTKERGLTVVTCQKLKVGMSKGMDEEIRGSRVNQCGTGSWKRPVPEVIWPSPDR